VADTFTEPSSLYLSEKDLRKKDLSEKGLCVVDPLMSREMFEIFRSLTRPFLSGFSIFYAVKCNPDLEILKTLNKTGCNFEVASVPEFTLISSLPGVNPYAIPVTNPILSEKDLTTLLRKNARIFVVDSIGQLQRLKNSCITTNVPFTEVKVLTRLAVSNRYAAWDLSDKFGVTAKELPPVLNYIKRTGFSFLGFSFHVGSQAQSVEAYTEALSLVEDSAKIAAGIGLSTKVVDIGGGFPVNYNGTNFKEVANMTANIFKKITDTVNVSPILSKLQFWAEPGRFIAAPTTHMVSPIIAKANRSGKPWLYAVVGTYNGPSEPRDLKDSFIFPVSFDPVKFQDSKLENFVLTGPTCDSSDVYSKKAKLPYDIDSNDTVQFPLSGAYSTSLWTSFNGFAPPPIKYMPGTILELYKK